MMRKENPTPKHSFAKELTSSQKKDLRAQAHGLKPYVQLGGEGLTPQVLGAIQAALDHHELIKVQLPGHSNAEEKELASKELLNQLGPRCHSAGRVGRMLILFQEKAPKEAKVKLQRP